MGQIKKVANGGFSGKTGSIIGISVKSKSSSCNPKMGVLIYNENEDIKSLP